MGFVEQGTNLYSFLLGFKGECLGVSAVVLWSWKSQSSRCACFMNKSFKLHSAAVCTKSFTTGRPTQRVTFTYMCWVLVPVPTHGRFRLLFQHRFSHAVVKNGALGVIFALGRACFSPRQMPLWGLPTPRLLLPDGRFAEVHGSTPTRARTLEGAVLSGRPGFSKSLRPPDAPHCKHTRPKNVPGSSIPSLNVLEVTRKRL